MLVVGIGAQDARDGCQLQASRDHVFAWKRYNVGVAANSHSSTVLRRWIVHRLLPARMYCGAICVNWSIRVNAAGWLYSFGSITLLVRDDLGFSSALPRPSLRPWVDSHRVAFDDPSTVQISARIRIVALHAPSVALALGHSWH